MVDYLIILPAYNEDAHIGKVIDSIMKLKEPCLDILVIDDGSKDNTANVVKNKNVPIVRHPINLGYGAALQTGFRFAKDGGYKYVITMDADGQHDPFSIPSLISTMESKDADVVIGSRFLQGGYRMPIARRIGSWIFAKIAHLYTGYKFTDPTSGFQLLNRDAFLYLASEDGYPFDYPDVNIIMLLHKKKFKVVEAPVKMITNHNADSMHSGLSPLFYTLRMVIAIMVLLMRKDNSIKKDEYAF